ncbi:hypothetical protein QBC40DRAFT_321888 [Triangularia verruculosa]|uniref:Uncharacterized protein n=1 Tax=Triangularia verruculosa TaxID=2587418 RepID=A0AAN6XMH6_9PEZI|nr:hypothetical protein QBC40DRAFT_321888 [Triangularia verruculosa]
MADTLQHHDHAEGQDDDTRSAATWKPVSVWPLTIGILAVLQLVPLIVLEVLLQKSRSTPLEFDTSDSSSYAAWQYPAMAFFLVDGLLWEAVFARICQLEPFYQLSLPDGASLENSLSMGYTNTITFWVPVTSAMAHHWTVFLASVGYISTFTLAPLCTRLSWTLDWPRTYSNATVTVLPNEPWCRALEALCVISAICGFGLAVMQRRRSGLFSEISSVEDLSRLLCDSPEFLALVKNIPSHADSKAVGEALQHCRFRLLYKTNRLQLVAFQNPPMAATQRTIVIQNRSLDAHPFSLFPAVILTAEVMVVGVYLPIALLPRFPPENFDPDTLRLLFTALLLINTAFWSGIQSSLSAILPYAHLTATRQAKDSRVRNYETQNHIRQKFTPGSTLLQLTAGSTPCLTALCGSLNLQLMILLINPLWDSTLAIVKKQGLDAPAPGCLLGPALLAQIFSYIVPILSFVAFLNALLYRRVFAPRKPDTLISKMIYLCRGERLLQDVKEGRVSGLCADDGCYSFGWFQGEEGRWFVGVDRGGSVAKEYKKVGEVGPDMEG